ncbi:MAG: transposase [Cytophagaceae bacterium]|nr:MAG: transposase [Cytophagaceae bacterium]
MSVPLSLTHREERNIQLAYTGLGKPWQNGSIQSSNSRFRDESLDTEWFTNQAEVRVLIKQWRKHYNEHRPHRAIGYRTPAEMRPQTLSPCAAIESPAIEAVA